MSKTILITGAASGFGKLVAFDLARRGHDVIATARGWSQVSELKDAASDAGLNMRVDKLDVTSASDREYAFGWDIDVLVSNAGVMEAGPIAEQPMELLRAMFEVNVFAGIALVQGFAKALRQEAERQECLRLVDGRAQHGCLRSGVLRQQARARSGRGGPESRARALRHHGRHGRPRGFATGFNDRGADSMRWYNPSKNFTQPESLSAATEVLAHQLDPQSMADVIVDVVLSDRPKFRNVHPKQTEDMLTQLQQDAWAAVS